MANPIQPETMERLQHQITDARKEELRGEAMSHSFGLAEKQRFGLFSQPASTAIGDNNKYPTKKANKDEDGKVIIGPTNFYTTRMKKGTDDSVFFSRPSYVCTGDLYRQNSHNGLRTIKKDGHIAAGHDRAFRPAKDPGIKVDKAPYAYLPQDKHVKKNFRDEEGGVKIGPRNFTTIPMKQGRVGKLTSFSGPIPYNEDPFDNKKVLAKKELEYHYSKVQEKPFSQQCKRLKWGTFNNPKLVYGEPEGGLPPKPKKKVEPPKLDENGEPLPPLHDRAFRPGGPKKSVHPTIEKFPVYMENPPKQLKRKVVVEGQEEEERPRFKLTYNYRSRPCNSVATNYRNLKTQFPSAFTRK